jgi:hypothetical protein
MKKLGVAVDQVQRLYDKNSMKCCVVNLHIRSVMVRFFGANSLEFSTIPTG